MNQMMLLAETEMRTTLNYGRKNYVSPEVRVMSFETEMMIAGSDMNPELQIRDITRDIIWMIFGTHGDDVFS